MDFDTATETHLALLYPSYARRLRMALEEFYAKTAHALKITEALRSFGRQKALFAQGRTTPGPNTSAARPLGSIVTNAPAGLSIHHYGTASDVAFQGADPYLAKEKEPDRSLLWSAWGTCAEQQGLTWGGNWGGSCSPHAPIDDPHTEISFGLKVQEMQKLYMAAGIKALWERFDTISGRPLGSGWSDRILYDPNK